MEEPVSWKGHSFTLFVFAGIVALCSIFFVLGMLVGRIQVRAASAPKKAARTEESQIVPDPETLQSPAAHSISFEVGEVNKLTTAENRVKEMKDQGFPAFILSPADGDPTPRYRIRVGPYENAAEADLIKHKLEKLGYTPVQSKK